MEQITLQIRNHLEQLLVRFFVFFLVREKKRPALNPDQDDPSPAACLSATEYVSATVCLPACLPGTIVIYLFTKRRVMKKNIIIFTFHDKEHAIFICQVYQGLFGKW